MSKLNKPRNPVAQHANEFNKPKTFRDRKKEFKLGEDKRDHPKHQPYARCPTNLHNLLLEDEDLDVYREEERDADNFPMESYDTGKAYDD